MTPHPITYVDWGTFIPAMLLAYTVGFCLVACIFDIKNNG